MDSMPLRTIRDVHSRLREKLRMSRSLEIGDSHSSNDVVHGNEEPTEQVQVTGDADGKSEETNEQRESAQ